MSISIDVLRTLLCFTSVAVFIGSSSGRTVDEIKRTKNIVPEHCCLYALGMLPARAALRLPEKAKQHQEDCTYLLGEN
jgi:hypothetical protein